MKPNLSRLAGNSPLKTTLLLVSYLAASVLFAVLMIALVLYRLGT